MGWYDLVIRSLFAASQEITKAIDASSCRPPSFDTSGDMGHPLVGVALQSFSNAWKPVLTGLAADGDATASSLEESANAYLAADAQGAGRIGAAGPVALP